WTCPPAEQKAVLSPGQSPVGRLRALRRRSVGAAHPLCRLRGGGLRRVPLPWSCNLRPCGEYPSPVALAPQGLASRAGGLRGGLAVFRGQRVSVLPPAPVGG